MAPVSCGGPHLSRSRSRRIWLCKQEVAGSNLAVPTTSYGCLADGTTHKRAVIPILLEREPTEFCGIAGFALPLINPTITLNSLASMAEEHNGGRWRPL